MTLGKSVAVGAAAGGGVGYAWARKQGQTGREAATTAAKGAVAGGAGGLVVSAGLARRRAAAQSSGGSGALAKVRDMAEAAGELAGDLAEQIEEATAPVLSAIAEAVEGPVGEARGWATDAGVISRKAFRKEARS